MQVMDFAGAEMFIRQDEQNHGGGMRSSCCMCHIAREKMLMGTMNLCIESWSGAVADHLR